MSLAIVNGLLSLLDGAESNLSRYRQMGDKKAIEAAEIMIRQLQDEIRKYRAA